MCWFYIRGFNFTIIVGPIALLFSLLKGWVRSAVIALAGMALYTLLVGAGQSVAAGDEGGRSDRETLVAVRGYSLLRTDHHSWVHFSTDGENVD